MNISLIWPAFVRGFALAVVASLLLIACSGDDEQQAGPVSQQAEHVWKAKTGAIDKARDVGEQIGKAAARQQQAAQKAAK